MAGSTLPRRALGRILRDLRIKAKKSQLAAGLAIEMSPPSVNRLEAGRLVKICTAQFKDLLDFYGADQESKDLVLGLVQEVKAAKGDPTGGWWRAYSDLVASHFDHFMSLEESCKRLTTFQLTLLPGLLQTPAYRRSIIVTDDPEMSAVDVERRLELAARRRSRLTENAEFEMNVILSESVLRHQVGGKLVIAEQLRHLADVGQLPNVSIRVVPYDVGTHRGLVAQSFTLFEFPRLGSRDLVEPPVVYVELREGALFLEEDRYIERHRKAVTDIGRVALGQDATRQVFLDCAKEYEA